jgi:ubiquinone/menaquinone biosynthesis methyltransferase
MQTDNIYSPEYVKELFDKMSNSYERMNFITSFGFSIRWRRQFLDVLKQTNNKIKIIDLMTGMGETWNSVVKKFPNAEISALDFSTEMLVKADRKNKKYWNNNIKLIQEDVLQNNLLDNEYDIVICSFGLKTFDDRQIEKLAIETKRILKTNGQFTFIEVSKPENKVLAFLYEFYLGKIIPILGGLFLGNPTEYKMLWKYTEKFESTKKAAQIFKEIGLKVEINNYFYGCATGFSGIKQA